MFFSAGAAKQSALIPCNAVRFKQNCCELHTSRSELLASACVTHPGEVCGPPE